MSDIDILLLGYVSRQEKIAGIARLINYYELPLSQEEIMQVFKKARRDISKGVFPKLWYQQHKFLFETLLNNNKNMFIAIAKSYIDGCMFVDKSFIVLVTDTSTSTSTSTSISTSTPIFNIGYCIFADYIPNIYCKLLDYNDFDIENLEICKHDKILIRNYKQVKYGGKLTKVANR